MNNKRFLVTISTEDDICHYRFGSRKNAQKFVMDELERCLPEELQTDHIMEYIGYEDDDVNLARIDEETREKVCEMYALLAGKKKMDFLSDDLYVSHEKVLYRSGDCEKIFNAEIVDLAEEEDKAATKKRKMGGSGLQLREWPGPRIRSAALF